VDIRVRSDVNMARLWRRRDWVHRLRPSHAIALAGLDPTPRGRNDYLHDRVFQGEHARLVGVLADCPAGAGRLLP
jgi:hypothetical protein